MAIKDFPAVHFYDQDFVEIYDRTWSMMDNYWFKGTKKNGFTDQYFNCPGSKTLSQAEACMSTFFLVYSNGAYPVHSILDNFYKKQEKDGAIRAVYDVNTGTAIPVRGNAKGASPPLFALAEYNLFHKVGNKKRLRDVMPYLEKYFDWLVKNFCKSNGLYGVPLLATLMDNSPRKPAYYMVDFNCQVAISALYLSAIGDILNDKELAFKYKKHFFSLKTAINKMMWDDRAGFYYDLDKDGKKVPVKTIASYWTLLGEIPDEDRAERLIEKLKNPKYFGTDHPFPSLSVSEKDFSEKGNGWHGSVFPFMTFVVIKGLEKYKKFEFARECSIRHLYFILDTLHLEDGTGGGFFEAYLPCSEGAAKWSGHPDFPRKAFLPFVGLSTITLMIENVLGLSISLPKKTVEWVIPSMEILGIENLSLKRNRITILSNKSGRGWEIRLESDKLYYFTIKILDEGKFKRLPIPSGKCSMLIDKL